MTNTQYSELLSSLRHNADIGMNDDQLAKELSFTRMTLYKRILDKKWKTHEIEKLMAFAKRFNLID